MVVQERTLAMSRVGLFHLWLQSVTVSVTEKWNKMINKLRWQWSQRLSSILLQLPPICRRGRGLKKNSAPRKAKELALQVSKSDSRESCAHDWILVQVCPFTLAFFFIPFCTNCIGVFIFRNARSCQLKWALVIFLLLACLPLLWVLSTLSTGSGHPKVSFCFRWVYKLTFGG